MVRKLLVCSQKGGVGKTTAAIALAGATALGGTRVLLLDADPLSNIASALNLFEHPQRQSLREAGIDLPGVLVSNVVPGLDVLSPYDEGGCSDDDLDALLGLIPTAAFQHHYGCLVVDTPPFMGPNPGQLVAACDEFLIVMRAEPMAYRTLPAFLELMQRAKTGEQRPIKMRGILLTLPEGETPGGRWERELRGRLGNRILPHVVEHDDAVTQAGLSHQIVTHSEPIGPAARTYMTVAEALDLAFDPRDTAARTSSISALELAMNQSKDALRKPGPAAKPATAANPTTAPVARPRIAPKPVAPRPEPAPKPPDRVPPPVAAPLPPVAPSARQQAPTPVVPAPPAAITAVATTPGKPAGPADPIVFPPWIAAVCVAVAVVVGVAVRFAPLNVLLPGLVGCCVAGVVMLLMRQPGVPEQVRAPAPPPRPAPPPVPVEPRPTPARRLSGLKRRLKAAGRDQRGN